MLWRQLLLLAVVAAATVLVVQRATRPVRVLGQTIQARAADDLSPIQAADAPRELAPLLDAMTAVMGPGDLNGDRTADVVARDARGNLWLYRGNGSGGWLSRVQIGTGWNGINAIF